MAKLLLVFLITILQKLSNGTIQLTEDWSKFTQEVEEAISSYSSYILPSNNHKYYDTESDDGDNPEKVADFGTYDFIIIGGGTAGGVLANRLTEEPFSVLVLEVGKEERRTIMGNRIGFIHVFLPFGLQWVWGYNSTPQTTILFGAVTQLRNSNYISIFDIQGSRNQRCFYPRGKALGGCSVVNGGLYVRGHPADYDQWEALGNPGWSYKDCLPYFKKSENAKFTQNIDPHYHGMNGPQVIDMPEDVPELTTTLLEAFGSIGKPEIDYNVPSLNGAGRMQYYLDYNTRASTARAFFEPVKSRPNLKISLESLVTKIRLSPRKLGAEGVEFVKNGQKYVAAARKEVIVSAGAINSPQILMLSGIGPKKELKRHGIKVLADLPVGKGMLDHVSFPCVYYR